MLAIESPPLVRGSFRSTFVPKREKMLGTLDVALHWLNNRTAELITLLQDARTVLSSYLFPTKIDRTFMKTRETEWNKRVASFMKKTSRRRRSGEF